MSVIARFIFRSLKSRGLNYSGNSNRTNPSCTYLDFIRAATKLRHMRDLASKKVVPVSVVHAKRLLVSPLSILPYITLTQIAQISPLAF